MYRMSQLMSTPVASSSWLEREHARELSPMCIFPSFACDFLDGDSSLECCSIDPVTGAHCPCRRSSRLLTNGYYIWTEDSFLYDKDGHISLNPSQTSVIYKENLVRIFRKKKRIRRSLDSLQYLSASESWLHGGILGAVDSSPSEDRGLEGLRRLGMHHCNESETSLLREVSCQAILLVACLIISSCVRWFMGGVLAGVFTCSLMITIAYVVKSLILHLASYVEDTACAQ
ncbi:PREDICTED: transmembrane protein 71 isoform X2 [Galeopterus variegatus]|uniref:Transmembrane protein 71 isoform X2 n=1 Tax=Galeopterus variegatus TaxID=482537 RepID=A0ABM0QJH7_GALVR|nr:PREDICTED: transmembrane protein 71 isoform X2 [Galeopterus variegatus]